MKMVYRYGAEKSNTIDRRLEEDEIDYELEGSDEERHLQDAEDAAGSCDICQGLVPAPNHMAGWSCMSEEGEMLGNSLGGVNGDPQNKGITSPHKCTQSGHDLRGYLCDEMVASFRVNAADSDQCAIGTQMVSSQEWIPWTQVVVIKQNSKIVSC
jgi:hypothetical protein